MYKAIGEAAYNDGLFSQAAPMQKYQASVSQFGDGAIGATSRVVIRKRNPPSQPMSAALQAINSGSLGRTFLPAFGARAMRGLGHAYRDGSLGQAYRDGSLGDAAQDAVCTPVRTCMNDILSAPQPMDRALKDPFNKLVAVSLVGIVGYLIYKR